MGLLIPLLCTVGWLRVRFFTVEWFQKPKKDQKHQKINDERKKKKNIVFLQLNISNTPFDHRSPQPPKVGVS